LEAASAVRLVSPWELASLAALPLAGVVYLLGRLEGDRMVAANQGWEMAFCLSPLVLGAVDVVLLLGAGAGLIGIVAGPHWHRRAVSATTSLACAGCFLALPWR